MAIKQLIYESRNLLSCSPCGGDLIVCVSDTLTVSGAPFIEGNLVGVTERGTVQDKWIVHVIHYEDTQLLAPEITLQGCAVTGLVCRGCMTKYVDYKYDQLAERITALEEAPEETPEG